MPMLSLVEMLAQVPSGALYASPWKLLVFIALFALWALFAQWVDKDTIAVNTYRTVWNMISMVTGAVALALLLFIPVFWGAIGIYIGINLIFAIFYVVHRNGLVVEENKVCTPAHISRVLREGFGKKKQTLLEVHERVQLRGPDRKVVQIPVDPVERQQYALLQDILYDSLWRRASVLEILPNGQASRVRLVVDGIASEREPIARTEGDALLAWFKRIGGLNLEERRKPQKGKIQAAIADTRFELIVKSTGSTQGESLAIRVVGAEKTMKIDDIGLTEPQVATFRELMHADKGLVVITAPPGGGLTTTLYSVARSHDAFLQNIQLLEYERELDIDNITQKTYVPSEEIQFKDELLKIFRSDPNVVVVPEIRDRDAAKVASEGAAKKQIVYVGLPAADVFDGLNRWIKLVGDQALVAKSLIGITHQRLVRKLCTVCRTPYKPDAAMLQKINMPPDTILHRPPEVQYDKRGNPIICQGCQGTGYVGRTAILVVLPIDQELREVIRKAKNFDEIRAAATKKGGLSLLQHALHKVRDGVTSIEDVQRALKPPGAGDRGAAPPAGERRQPTANAPAQPAR